jgi:hypothetical protein
MAKRSPDKDYTGSTPLQDPKHEIFCVIFNTNTMHHFWANGQNSYEFAYGIIEKIEGIEDQLEELDGMLLWNKKQLKAKKKTMAGIEREQKILRRQIANLHRNAARSASKLMARPEVRLRCGFLLNELAKDMIVDQELSFLIQQRDNLQVKQNAIAHYDKKMQRITDRLDVKHHFDPVKTIRMNAAKKPA